jgi:hypothetical protein
MTTTYCQEPAIRTSQQPERHTFSTTFPNSNRGGQPSATPPAIGMSRTTNRFLEVLLRSLSAWTV